MFGGAPPRMLNSVVEYFLGETTAEAQSPQRLRREKVKQQDFLCKAASTLDTFHTVAGILRAFFLTQVSMHEKCVPL